MKNKCGLIAGNLKRHLLTHRIFVSHLHGEALINEIDINCGKCLRHADALEQEMKKI